VAKKSDFCKKSDFSFVAKKSDFCKKSDFSKSINTNMVNFYYEALTEQRQSADKLREQVSESLNLFGDYLHTAISALKNKEVKCLWEPVSGYQYQLKPKSRVYQWQLWTEIRIQGDEPGWFWITKDLDDEQPPGSDFQPDVEETIRIGKGVHAKKFLVLQNNCNDRVVTGDCFWEQKLRLNK
jgi:hypothetical protein